MKMNNLKFNFCIPREYKDNDTQEIIHYLRVVRRWMLAQLKIFRN